MTDRIAYILAAFIGVALLGDAFFNSGTGSLFVLRKLADLVEFLAFWR